MKYGMISLSKRAALLISLIILCITSNAHASVKYTIRKGDNLSKIAKKFGVSAGSIRKENGLDSGKLKPGKKIVIPVREASAHKKRKGRHGDTGKTTVKPSDEDASGDDGDQPSQTSAQSFEQSYHTVKRGETLRSIAKKYSITVAELK